MQKKILFIILLLFSYSSIVVARQVPERDIKQINNISQKFFSSIRSKNYKLFISLLKPSDGILIDDDSYYTKEEVISDFKRYGRVFSEYFDTRRYNSENTDYINSLLGPGKNNFKYCIRDVVLRHKKIFIEKIYFFANQSDSVMVQYSWKGKNSLKSESRKILYEIGFQKISGKWFIVTLNLRSELY